MFASYHRPFPSPPPPKGKQVFAPHANTTVPLDYVITVYESCHTIMDKQQKMEMYATYGVDGEMVETYLDTVLQLNRIVKKA